MREYSRGGFIGLSVFGDCEDCGHSAIYHMPLFGCMKCTCDEFH